MYERFTDRARKVMQLANQEAQRLNHEWVGAEHLLLGLIKEGSGMATHVMTDLGVDSAAIRQHVLSMGDMNPRADMVTMGKLPHTPRAKEVIEGAIVEAKHLWDNYVGTEHLLLGLLRLTDGALSVILAKHLRPEGVYESIKGLKAKEESRAPHEELPPRTFFVGIDAGLSPAKRLAREIMGLTLWEYAELNKELRRLGVMGVSMNKAVQTAWHVTVPVDLGPDPEPSAEDAT